LLLADCLAEWNRIAADLAEPPRHRKHQLDTLYEFVQY